MRHGVASPDEILDLLTGIWRAGIMRAALDLDVFGHLAAGRRTAEAIASAEGADARRLGILLDALCALGLADKENGTYAAEPLARELLPRDRPIGRAGPIWLGDPMWTAWGDLAGTIRRGAPHDLGDAGDEFWDTFARSTFAVALLAGAATAARLGLPSGGDTRVLDVACGSGGVGLALAQADPGVRLVGIDQPQVVPIAAEHAASLGVGDRASFRVADIAGADSFGDAEYDVAILSHILHGWPQEVARALLGAVARALVPGGRLVVNEYCPDEERRRALVPLMFGVQMTLFGDGDAYTLGQIEGWLDEAGFTGAEPAPFPASVTQILATKA